MSTITCAHDGCVMAVSWLPSVSSSSHTLCVPSSRCSSEAATMQLWHAWCILVSYSHHAVARHGKTYFSWRVEHLLCGKEPLTPPRLLPAPGNRCPALSFYHGDCFGSICQWIDAHNLLRIVLSVSWVNCYVSVLRKPWISLKNTWSGTSAHKHLLWGWSCLE